ncbi:MAG: NUDIX domain-containing protein [Leptolyngbyaceae bacterium]|nr:NUDIX domain-containing protein [Leptolyngbyaceae bacterium]
MDDSALTPTTSIKEVAIAILYQGDRFLLQLRDDIPTIRYPGHWAFFGGHLESGEHPDDAIARELQEEINYVPSNLSLYRSCPDGDVIRHVYHAPLLVGLDALTLGEGWDMDLLTQPQIQHGEHYSAHAGKICPLGPPHRQLLLTFIAEHPHFWTKRP